MSISLLVLRFVPPSDGPVAVVHVQSSDSIRTVKKAPSRPVFTSQYPVFSPVLSVISEASLHTLPGRGLVGDYASSASSTDSVLLEENEDLEEEPELPESPVTTRVALQNPLLSSENPKPAGNNFLRTKSRSQHLFFGENLIKTSLSRWIVCSGVGCLHTI